MSSVRSRRPRQGRRVDKTGRSIGDARFLKLEHWIFKTDAWRSLSVYARALYVEVAQRYNGINNGEISLSVREASRNLHIAKDTASKAFRELEQKGFIRRNICGSFNWKLKHATTWIMTEHPLNDQLATKDFVRWQPEKSEPGPKIDPDCPSRGTPSDHSKQRISTIGPGLGPWVPFCTVPRSQITARI